jgi:hypothetical protein
MRVVEEIADLETPKGRTESCGRLSRPTASERGDAANLDE